VTRVRRTRARFGASLLLVLLVSGVGACSPRHRAISAAEACGDYQASYGAVDDRLTLRLDGTYERLLSGGGNRGLSRGRWVLHHTQRSQTGTLIELTDYCIEYLRPCSNTAGISFLDVEWRRGEVWIAISPDDSLFYKPAQNGDAA